MKELQRLAACTGFIAALFVASVVSLNPATARSAAERSTVLAAVLGLHSTSGAVLGATSVGAPGGLQFNVTWDPSVANAPAAFEPAVLNALSILTANFSAPITLYITVGWGNVPAGSQSRAEFTYYGSLYSYPVIKYLYDQYAASGASADVVSAVANNLPQSNPDPYYKNTQYNPDVVAEFFLPQAQMKALKFETLFNYNYGTNSDGGIWLSDAVDWCYDKTLGCPPTSIDFQAAVLKEVTELMGRDTYSQYLVSSISPYELFDFRGGGVLNTHSGTYGGGYFSIDDGQTSLAPFATSVNLGDWSLAGDAFNTTIDGPSATFSEADLKAMDILGYHRSSSVIIIPGGCGPGAGYSAPILNGTASSSTAAHLIWTLSIPDCSASTTAGYNIFQNGARIATTTDNAYDVGSLSPGTSYKFNVSAFDLSGHTSPLSNTVTIKTPRSSGGKSGGGGSSGGGTGGGGGGKGH